MIKLALETGNGVVRLRDKIIFLVKGEEKPRIGTLNEIFTSVHNPSCACFGIAEEPCHISYRIADVWFIDKAEEQPI